VEEQKNHQLSPPTTPNMSYSPSSLNAAIIPVSKNVLMDIDSNPEADQEAQDMELIL